MKQFRAALKERLVGPKKRSTWLFVPYDQLTSAIGPLSRKDPSDVGIVIVENRWKPARRPYHKQKLALVLGNMRQFALEQAARGVAVKHIAINSLYRDAFPPLLSELGPIQVMRPAERELREDLRPLMESGLLTEIPHEGWLTSQDVLTDSHPKGAPYLLERFYRLARQRYGVLMDGKEPLGGQYNFDAENRHPWRPGDPEPADFPGFPNDPIKQEVVESIESEMSRHPGTLDPDALPTTAIDAQNVWRWAMENCLENFGKYEDAMTTRSSTLFHTRISALLNLHRLLPVQVVRQTETLDIPLASKEGFIRQILGWREFMHHVHEITDGFRLAPEESPVKTSPGDGGFERWAHQVWVRDEAVEEPDGGACPSALGVSGPLPPAYWGRKSGLNCLDTVVANVWKEGWSHHITRLMVLSNFATLLDVSPRELTDWFWVAYIDAYDWVVEPNVLGLGTFGTGHLFTTKPYVSGANYIHRMSNYCEGCQFDPKKDCPFGPLYWAFLERHYDVLERNPRLATIYRTLRKRRQQGAHSGQEVFIRIRDTLARGEEWRSASQGGVAPLQVPLPG